MESYNRSSLLTPKVKAKIFRATGIQVFDYQAEIHKSNARFRVVDGGRRIGKSRLGGHEAFAQCIIPGSMVWVVGPTQDLAEKEFRVVWKKGVDEGLIPVKRKSQREGFIEFENGSYIECRSEENPDQLIGEGLDLIVVAEAARLKENTWHQLLRPALADRQGRALFTSTPRGYNWFYDFYLKGQDPETAENWWRSWMIPSSMNPILPAMEIEEARRNSTPEAFAQEWEAKFIAYAGLVFPEFSEKIHVKKQVFSHAIRTALWVDPGSTAPYCVLLVQITPDEQVHVLDEIYLTGHTTPQIIDIAREKWGQWILDDFNNPKEDLDVIVDKAASEPIATWRLNGFRAGGDKPTKIERGIEVHHQFLRDPIRSKGSKIVPRITFSPRCVNTIKEHGLYRYPDESRKRVEHNKSERPVDVDNHAIDAIRYGYFNTFPELFNETPQREDYETVELEELIPEYEDRVSLGSY
jgi:hypothetical protein